MDHRERFFVGTSQKNDNSQQNYSSSLMPTRTRNTERRDSHSERFLHATDRLHLPSKSQEDLRNCNPVHGSSHRTPQASPKSQEREKRKSRVPPGRFEEVDRNYSTDDDELDFDSHNHHRPKSRSDPKSFGNYGYADDETRVTTSRYRILNGAESCERREQRRASHSDVIRNYNLLHNRSASPRLGNPTIQLHFGGQEVKDYNQYSSSPSSSLSHRKSADAGRQHQYQYQPSSGRNDAERGLPSPQAGLTAASYPPKSLSPTASYVADRHFHAPSGRHNNIY